MRSATGNGPLNGAISFGLQSSIRTSALPSIAAEQRTWIYLAYGAEADGVAAPILTATTTRPLDVGAGRRVLDATLQLEVTCAQGVSPDKYFSLFLSKRRKVGRLSSGYFFHRTRNPCGQSQFHSPIML